MEKISCVLVEDNSGLVRAITEKIALFDNVNLLFVARNGQEVLHSLESDQPDVILMDINMPIMNGIEATAEIKRLYPEIKVLMLTVFDDEEHIFESIVAGASGYLLKDEKPGVLINAIEEVLEGGAPMSASIALKAINLIRLHTRLPAEVPDFKLTKREMEILEHLSLGETYQIIADRLFISPKTVRKHIENIYGKLQVHNKVEAVQKAIKYQLFTD